MLFDIDEIKSNYKVAEQQGWKREIAKWLFSIATFGLGGLYLWLTTSIIKEGEIGLRCDHRGKMILLPPGRHSNFPWESYAVDPQPLSEKIINLGPYKIITVETGFVAKTINQGKLLLLKEGQHLLSHASHVFEKFISIKQETKELEAITACTKDNVGLSLHADVRYMITDPNKAIESISDIDKSIIEIAEVNIAQSVSHHNLADFAPVTNVSQDQQSKSGFGEVIKDITTVITKQLKGLGIQLLSIGITSWTIKDEKLAHELAQGAVMQSQSQSKMLVAKREAKIAKIEAESQAKAKAILAQADADAIKVKGTAIKEVAKQIENDPTAKEIYARSQHIDLVRGANNPNLFFTQQPLPVTVSANTNTMTPG